MMRKGITPIVSIIILLLITVALAGAAFTFLQGYLFTYTGSSFRMDAGMVFCVNTGTENVITAQVTNTGQQSLDDADFTVAQIDGVNSGTSLGAPLQPGEAGILIDAYDCGGSGCTSGTHTVSVGTAAGVTTVNVYCP
jgi:flagellin-like protein